MSDTNRSPDSRLLSCPMPPLLTAVVGIVVSLLGLGFVRGIEGKVAWNEFCRSSSECAAAIRHEVTRDLLFLEAARGLFQASHDVTRDEFHSFCSLFLAKVPETRAWAWAPRVQDSQRQECEERTRQAGFPGFRFRQRDAGGTLVSATPRDEYFPVFYSVPLQVNEGVLGFDLASEPTRRAAMHQSCDTGELILTSPLALVLPTGHREGILAFMPVYAGPDCRSVAERRAALKGFVVNVFCVDRAVEVALASFRLENLRLEILDQTDPARPKRVFRRRQPAGAAQRGDGSTWSASFDLGGRRWEIHTAALAPFFAQRRTWQPWGVLVAGLLLTGVAVTRQRRSVRRTAEVEQLVAQRTRQLEQSEQKFRSINQALCEAIREAEAANNAKTQFLTNMSHELRTPLHGILSYAQFGRKEAATADRDELFEFFRLIEKSGHTLLDLVNDLLDLSKLESGRFELNWVTVDLVDLATAAAAELRPLAAQRQLRLTLDVAELETRITADPSRLMQVLRNLLSNAVKFSPPGTAIEIQIGQRDGQLALAVCDRGLGIPEGEIEAIFDKFIQSSKTRTGAGGSGLGLAICRQIIEAHGGRIWAENRDGGGAVLVFVLPGLPAAPPAATDAVPLAADGQPVGA